MRSAVGLCSHWLSECLEFASSLLTDVSQFDFKLTIKPHHQEQTLCDNELRLTSFNMRVKNEGMYHHVSPFHGRLNVGLQMPDASHPLKIPTTNPPQNGSPSHMAWFFKVARGWAPYSKEQSELLEAGFQRFHAGQKEPVVLDQWRVDLEQMSLE